MNNANKKFRMYKSIVFIFLSFLFLISCFDKQDKYIQNILSNSSNRTQILKEIISNDNYYAELNNVFEEYYNSKKSPLIVSPSVQLNKNKFSQFSSDEEKFIAKVISGLRHVGGKDTNKCILTYTEVLQNGHVKSYTLKHTCGKRESTEK